MCHIFGCHLSYLTNNRKSRTQLETDSLIVRKINSRIFVSFVYKAASYPEKRFVKTFISLPGWNWQKVKLGFSSQRRNSPRLGVRLNGANSFPLISKSVRIDTFPLEYNWVNFTLFDSSWRTAAVAIVCFYYWWKGCFAKGLLYDVCLLLFKQK